VKGPSSVLFENLCVDFEAAWNAMATTEFVERTSGSFLFARQAMLLVELASTVARQDAATFRRFSRELQKREALLFKAVPYKPGPGTHARVPRIAPENDPTSELIALLFDLIWKGRTIDTVRPPGGRILNHLSCTKQTNGDLVMRLCPGTLYLDVRDASESAGVWDLDADASRYTEARMQEVTVEELQAALTDPTGPYMPMFSSRAESPG
jgi:hypothetical protein